MSKWRSGLILVFSFVLMLVPSVAARAQGPAAAGVDGGSASSAPGVQATDPGVEVKAVTGQRGIKVIKPRLSRNGRVITATIRWNRELIDQPGKQDHFRYRVVAFGKKTAAHPSVIRANNRKVAPKLNQKLRLKLTRAQARTIRKSRDVVLSVSQHHRSPKRIDKKYDHNYVRTVHLLRTVHAAAAAPSSCTGVVGPGANLSNCDLAGADLRNDTLKACNLSNAKLQGADLSGRCSRGAM
ncbi:MAG: pentapeptide repeat-containing protein [Sporocytophaga sp.]|nr:pentapeptide repeat-containing protein [Sporocytophaga sp.]